MTVVLRYLPLTLIVLLAATLLLAGAPDRLRPDALLAEATQLMAWAELRPLVWTLLMAGLIAGLTASGLPGAAAVFLLAGFLVGLIPALLAAIAGNVVGTCALYFALRQALFRSPPAPRPPRLIASFRDRPFVYALLLRAIPVVPNGATTTILAALRCPWPSFIAASAIGHLPNAGLLAWLGAQAAVDLRAGRALDADLLSDPRWWLPLALIAVLAALSLLLRRRQRRPIGAMPGSG